MRTFLSRMFHYCRCYCNQLFFFNALLSRRMLHLGCGFVRIKDAINIDIQSSRACDLVHTITDVSHYPDNHFSVVFMNAVFEHMYKKDQIPLLSEVKRILKNDGHILITGIPDFNNIAYHYLHKSKPGIRHKIFDLHDAYVLTHGDPDINEGWHMPQLHKSLFDVEELKTVISKSGFINYVIFSYVYGDDKLRLSLGIIGWKEKPMHHNRKQLIDLIMKFPCHMNTRSFAVEFRSF